MNCLGSRLRHEIEVRGLQHQEFAERIDVSARTLRMYLNSSTRPGADVLERIAGEGIDIFWLVTGRLNPRFFFSWRDDNNLEIDGYLAEDIEVAKAVFGRLQYDFNLLNVEKFGEKYAHPENVLSNENRISLPFLEVASLIWKIFYIWSKRIEPVASKIRALRADGASAWSVTDILFEIVDFSIPDDISTELKRVQELDLAESKRN